MINFPTTSSGSSLYCRSAERNELKIGWSKAEQWAGIAEKRWSGAEPGAGMERGAGVKEKGCSAEQLFRRLHSAHMLW